MTRAEMIEKMKSLQTRVLVAKSEVPSEFLGRRLQAAATTLATGILSVRASKADADVAQAAKQSAQISSSYLFAIGRDKLAPDGFLRDSINELYEELELFWRRDLA